MPNYPSLAELMAAYKNDGLGDAINAGVAGYNTGQEKAQAELKRKQDFQAKLQELGIAGKKAEADTLEAATKKRHQDASEIPANMTGVDSLNPLGDRPVDISALNAKTKAEAKPGARSQYIGPALDAAGKPIPGKVLNYIPDLNGGVGRVEVGDLPTGVTGAGMKNTPNAPASQVADEGSVATQSGMLDQAEKMLNALPNGGIMEGARGMAVKLPLVGGTIAGPEKTYQDFMPAFATAVYRAQTGDTRLSDADAAQRAYPLLPSLSDPAPVREKKMQVIRDLFRNRQSVVQQQQGVSRNLPGSGITNPPPPTNDRESKKAALKAKLGI